MGLRVVVDRSDPSSHMTGRLLETTRLARIAQYSRNGEVQIWRSGCSKGRLGRSGVLPARIGLMADIEVAAMHQHGLAAQWNDGASKRRPHRSRFRPDSHREAQVRHGRRRNGNVESRWRDLHPCIAQSQSARLLAHPRASGPPWTDHDPSAAGRGVLPPDRLLSGGSTDFSLYCAPVRGHVAANPPLPPMSLRRSRATVLSCSFVRLLRGQLEGRAGGACPGILQQELIRSRALCRT